MFDTYASPLLFGMYPYFLRRNRASPVNSSCHFLFSMTIASTVRSRRPRS